MAFNMGAREKQPNIPEGELPFGLRLRAARRMASEGRGLTPAELGELADPSRPYSPGYISRVELSYPGSGARVEVNPSLDFMNKAAAALGTTVEDIMAIPREEVIRSLNVTRNRKTIERRTQLVETDERPDVLQALIEINGRLRRIEEKLGILE
jgi:hypothetical protein